MALVNVGGLPLIALGTHHIYLQNQSVVAPTNTTLDAANEAAIMIGRVWTSDGGTHTIDTTGSSSLGYRPATSTFANGGTTVKVGLATADLATTRPPRATNVANVITYSVSKTHTGSGTPTIVQNTWNENVPDAGTMTIAHGDIIAFAVQMTARAGADSVLVSHGIHGNGLQFPVSVSYVGGTYARASAVPNCTITFSDGARGYFYGSAVTGSFGVGQSFGTGTAQVEYGNFIQSPVPLRVYGVMAVVDFDGPADVCLYSNPLSSPGAAQRSVSVTTASTAANGNFWGQFMFDTPYDMQANQPYAITLKPTSATQITTVYHSQHLAVYQETDHFGQNCYAISRASGGGNFATINSSKDRFGMALLVSAFETGIGSASPSYVLGLT